MHALINNENKILGISIYTKLLLKAVQKVMAVQRTAHIKRSHFLFKMSVPYPIISPNTAFVIVKAVPVTIANYWLLRFRSTEKLVLGSVPVFKYEYTIKRYDKYIKIVCVQ